MVHPTSPSAAAFIQGHLFEDLELIAQRSGTDVIQPVLPAGCENGLLPADSADGVAGAEGRAYRGGSSAFSGPATREGADQSCTAFMILQVVTVQDVSLPLEQRLRAMAGDPGVDSTPGASAPRGRASNESNHNGSNSSSDSEEGSEGRRSTTAGLADSVLKASEAAHEARRRQRRRHVSGRRRWLSLVLTDGFTRVLAVEAHPPLHGAGRGGVLLPEGVALGAKLKVSLALSPSVLSSSSSSSHTTAPQGQRWVPEHSHGILRLHAENTTPMGGSVAALEIYWQRWASAQLAKLSGRPSRVLPQQQQEEGEEQQQQRQQQQPVGGSQHPQVHHSLSSDREPQQPQAADAIADAVRQRPLSQQQQQIPSLPLEQWPSTPPNPQGLFLTRAVITEVVSDLLINEPHSEDGEEEQLRSNGREDLCVYSLMVALSNPDSLQDHHDSSGAPAFSLHVDLGHPWLQQLVGMPAHRFRDLSLSREPQAVEQLQRIVDHVGSVLENLGEAFFYLKRRPTDNVVETVKVAPVVGDGHTQQQHGQWP